MDSSFTSSSRNPDPQTSSLPDDHPITFGHSLVPPSTIYDRSAPINRDLLIYAITLNTESADTFIGNTRIDFALGKTTPTTQSEFDALQRVFPPTQGANLLFRGFWQPVRQARMRWPVHKIIRPQGRSLVIQIRSIASLGPAVGISRVFAVVLTRDPP